MFSCYGKMCTFVTRKKKGGCHVWNVVLCVFGNILVDPIQRVNKLIHFIYKYHVIFCIYCGRLEFHYFFFFPVFLFCTSTQM